MDNSNLDTFFKNSRRMKTLVQRDIDLKETIKTITEHLTFNPDLEIFNQSYFHIAPRYRIGLKIRDKSLGYVESAVMGDIYNPSLGFISSPFVVIVGQFNGKLVYLVEHLEDDLHKFPLDHTGAVIKIPFIQGKRFNRLVNHMSNKGYIFDENELGAFSIKFTRNPLFFLTNLTCLGMQNVDEIYSGATIGIKGEFRTLKSISEKLLSNEYSLRL